MIAEATISSTARRANAHSQVRWPRRSSVVNKSTVLSQPAQVSAVAMPRAPKYGKRLSAIAQLTATATAEKRIGVRVSSRA